MDQNNKKEYPRKLPKEIRNEEAKMQELNRVYRGIEQQLESLKQTIESEESDCEQKQQNLAQMAKVTEMLNQIEEERKKVAMNITDLYGDRKKYTRELGLALDPSSSSEGSEDSAGPVEEDSVPTCFCQKEKDGLMIECDNIMCEILRFHGDCVELKSKPEKWFCPICRTEDSSVMRLDIEDSQNNKNQ